LGFWRFQEYSSGGIQRTSVSSRALQHFEPHELPSTEQRYQLTDFQSDSES